MSSLYTPSADDVKQRLRPFGFFFEKSLKDLIRGIRAHNDTPENLHQFLTKELSECRNEANSTNVNLKTNAILKLTYLEMYGFDMSWCNFHILEVMSSDKLQNKRVGYLAASQSFNRDPDILVLMTNLLKKDLKYANKDDMVKVGIVLSGISTIITPSLAADIADDLFVMLNSSKPYIRKKTVTALFKVFMQYPEALRDNFDKFVSKLEDEDMSVVSATVSVICELSKQNPYPFIQLSPLLYELLLNIDNNWIIIRLLKLFTNLSKIEPKLKFKLLPKIIELMDSTMATSVLYESINCIVKGDMLSFDDFNTAMKCLDCLHTFCDSRDPNLRYISCILFYKIGKINTQFVERFDSLIIRLLTDVDVSIRSKAIELLDGIVNEDNLKNIVTTLMKQFVNEEIVVIENSRMGTSKDIPIVIPDSYKVKVVKIILQLCSDNNYNNVSDFEWLNAVLVDLTVVSQDLIESKEKIGHLIGEQMRNIMIKVPELRSTTITSIIEVISMDSITTRLPTVLKGCIWSLGEYSSLIENGDALTKLLMGNALNFDFETQVILIPTILKIFSSWCNTAAKNDTASIKLLLKDIIKFLEHFILSKSFEVQERSIEANEILKLILDALDMESQADINGLPLLLSEILPSFFNTYELKPIAIGTQRHLPQDIQFDIVTPFLTQEGLENIYEEYNVQNNDECIHIIDFSDDDNYHIDKVQYENDTDETSDDEFDTHYKDFDNAKSNIKVREDKEQEHLSNPFYLKDDKQKNRDEAKSDRDIFTQAGDENGDRQSNIIKVTAPSIKRDDANQEVEGKKSKSKKKKKKAKKVKVLSDEVILPETERATTQHESKERTPPTMHHHNSDGIQLNLRSKLGNFDFSSDRTTNRYDGEGGVDANGCVEDDDQSELEKLRQKFASQSVSDPLFNSETIRSSSNVSNTNNVGNDNDDDDDDDEVVVVKKKKKKTKKGKKEKKDKKDKAKSPAKEASMSLTKD